jgi:hypothetical protein
VVRGASLFARNRTAECDHLAPRLPVSISTSTGTPPRPDCLARAESFIDGIGMLRSPTQMVPRRHVSAEHSFQSVIYALREAPLGGHGPSRAAIKRCRVIRSSEPRISWRTPPSTFTFTKRRCGATVDLDRVHLCYRKAWRQEARRMRLRSSQHRCSNQTCVRTELSPDNNWM